MKEEQRQRMKQKFAEAGKHSANLEQMETKITFEKLPDGTCVITVKGKNIHGETYLRQEIIKESAVFDALKLKIEH